MRQNHKETSFIFGTKDTVSVGQISTRIYNFYEKAIVNYDNEVNTLLSKMPWLNLTEFANMLGMHKSKLDRFRYGIWTPSTETLRNIRQKIAEAGSAMCAAASAS